MICGEDEIGLATDHAGINGNWLKRPLSGSPLKLFKLNDDYLYEIGPYPNRADAARI